MTDDSLPTTRDETIDSLREVARDAPRSIVHEDYVRRVCENLEIDTPEESLERIGDMPAMVDPDNDSLGMGFAYLMAHVVGELGGDATSSSIYMGRGRNAEAITQHNLKELNRLLE